MTLFLSLAERNQVSHPLGTRWTGDATSKGSEGRRASLELGRGADKVRGVKRQCEPVMHLFPRSSSWALRGRFVSQETPRWLGPSRGYARYSFATALRDPTDLICGRLLILSRNTLKTRCTVQAVCKSEYSGFLLSAQACQGLLTHCLL